RRLRPDPHDFPCGAFPRVAGQALGSRASHSPLSPAQQLRRDDAAVGHPAEDPLPLRGEKAGVVTGAPKAGSPAAIRHAHRVGRLLIAAAVAATLVVPIVLGGREALLAALHFSIQGYFGIFALIVASWAGRALKLQVLLRRLDVRASLLRSLGISLATDFAFITTPGGVGGYAASVYYLRRAGASSSGAAAVTAADQGMDVLFFVVALPLAALSLLWSDVPRSLSTVALATSALIALAALVAWLSRQ